MGQGKVWQQEDCDRKFLHPLFCITMMGSHVMRAFLQVCPFIQLLHPLARDWCKAGIRDMPDGSCAYTSAHTSVGLDQTNCRGIAGHRYLETASSFKRGHLHLSSKWLLVFRGKDIYSRPHPHHCCLTPSFSFSYFCFIYLHEEL